MGDTSSSIPVQGVIDFLIVSSFYQHSFESPKSVKVRHELPKHLIRTKTLQIDMYDI